MFTGARPGRPGHGAMRQDLVSRAISYTRETRLDRPHPKKIADWSWSRSRIPFEQSGNETTWLGSRKRAPYKATLNKN